MRKIIINDEKTINLADVNPSACYIVAKKITDNKKLFLSRINGTYTWIDGELLDSIYVPNDSFDEIMKAINKKNVYEVFMIEEYEDFIKFLKDR